MRRLIALIAGLLLSSIAFAGTATISWQAPTTTATGGPLTGIDVLTGYRLYERCGTGAETVTNLPLTPTTVTRSNLPDGVTCFWQLTAVNAGGESSRTAQASKAIPGVPVPPNPPTNVVVAAVSGSTMQPVYTITASGARSTALAGLVPVGTPCLGDVAFTYRQRSWRRVDPAAVRWWATARTPNAAAPCATST